MGCTGSKEDLEKQPRKTVRIGKISKKKKQNEMIENYEDENQERVNRKVGSADSVAQQTQQTQTRSHFGSRYGKSGHSGYKSAMKSSGGKRQKSRTNSLYKRKSGHNSGHGSVTGTRTCRTHSSVYRSHRSSCRVGNSSRNTMTEKERLARLRPSVIDALAETPLIRRENMNDQEKADFDDKARQMGIEDRVAFQRAHSDLIQEAEALETSAVFVDVSTPKGSFRGQKHQFTIASVEYSADVFYGIPYAKPPIGPLRFLPPQPVEPSTELRYTIEKPNACMQWTPRVKTKHMLKFVEMTDHTTDEDCLYLNVYRSSNLSADANVSVMVWIHGGGFVAGSASLQIYDGRYLATLKDVIVVAINYRLDALGFSYLGQGSIPGNVGLLDQRLALQWIKENIASFGGDPDSVTIFGNSAGGASVDAHVQSPGSAGLFKRAIIQSGAVSNIWASKTQERGTHNTLELAKLLNCNVSATEAAITDCLRQTPAINLVYAAAAVRPAILVRPPFGPVMNDGIFFMKNKTTVKPVDVMIGVTQKEGNFYMPSLFRRKATDLAAGIDISEYERAVQMLFYNDFPFTWRDVAYEYLRKGLRRSSQQQLGESTCNTNGTSLLYRDLVTDIISDYLMTCGCLAEAKNLVRHGNRVYVYEFREYLASTVPWMRSYHGEDLEYIFGFPLAEPSKYDFKDRRQAGTHLRIAEDMMEMWTSFAKTGNPTARMSTDWPLGPDHYMNIEGEGKHRVGQGMRSEECAYWRSAKQLGW